jgi:hypothetical protein
MTRRPVGTHPDWCAQGHRCGLGEHRADPLVIHTPDHDRIVLTRVRASDGRDHAEVRLRVQLSGHKAIARQQLLTLATRLDALLRSIAAAPLTTRRNHNGTSS